MAKRLIWTNEYTVYLQVALVGATGTSKEALIFSAADRHLVNEIIFSLINPLGVDWNDAWNEATLISATVFGLAIFNFRVIEVKRVHSG